MQSKWGKWSHGVTGPKSNPTLMVVGMGGDVFILVAASKPGKHSIIKL